MKFFQMTYIEFDVAANRPGKFPVGHLFIRSLCFLLVLWVSVAGAQERVGISDAEVTALTSRAMTEFNVPARGGKWRRQT